MTLQHAQVNIARMRGALDDPVVREFVERGATPFAFTFRELFPADDEQGASTDWSAFEPCPAI